MGIVQGEIEAQSHASLKSARPISNSRVNMKKQAWVGGQISCSNTYVAKLNGESEKVEQAVDMRRHGETWIAGLLELYHGCTTNTSREQASGGVTK